jgi:HAE1 family hydrophobic/amphiphilic exporter-1
MSDDLSEGIHFQKINDAKLYLDASIHTVLETLFEAILLVILVVWVFLQDLRSTFIPSVSIVVSLIGTFAFIQLMGFSLNLLTLLALVLAIGTVVDDAIIVVEAVQANFDRGYRSPYLSSTDAMHNVAMALLTSTIVFMAVFIPVSMIGGTSGAFYRQFGLTMAAAVGISAINAFTLSPALFALLLLMTVLTMLLGMLPLMMATGAGANGGRSLASCVVGGMTLGILALLFLVPALFIIFQWLQERMMPRKMVE